MEHRQLRGRTAHPDSRRALIGRMSLQSQSPSNGLHPTPVREHRVTKPLLTAALGAGTRIKSRMLRARQMLGGAILNAAPSCVFHKWGKKPQNTRLQNNSSDLPSLFCEIWIYTRSFFFNLNTVTLADGSAAPDNSRPPARAPPERPARLAKKPSPVSSPSSSLFQSRPTKRLESGAVLREKKRAAAHRSSPACPGATPTSGSGEPAHTIEKIDPNPSSSRARCDLINIHMSAPVGGSANTPVFFFLTSAATSTPPTPKHFLAGGPERGASSADGSPAAQLSDSVPRREVSPGPAYAQHRVTPTGPTKSIDTH